jgi:polyisoprenoid-binding protein YceI
MKKFALAYRMAIIAAILAILAPFALSQSTTWNIDPAHSGVEFGIRHLGISNVHGQFGKVTGSIILDQANITKSSVNATIDIVGLNTGNDARDTHLKSPDFFDATKFTTATFVSTSVQKEGAGIKISGNLTLHGVTKPVVLTVETLGAPVTNPMDHKQHAGFEATTTISRVDFGVGNFPDSFLSYAVKLTIEVEAVQQ